MNAMATDKPASANSMSRLSERERQISYLVARGMKNRDIATDLEDQRKHGEAAPAEYFSKTGTRDRLELAILALGEIDKAA